MGKKLSHLFFKTPCIILNIKKCYFFLQDMKQFIGYIVSRLPRIWNIHKDVYTNRFQISKCVGHDLWYNAMQIHYNGKQYWYDAITESSLIFSSRICFQNVVFCNSDIERICVSITKWQKIEKWNNIFRYQIIAFSWYA